MLPRCFVPNLGARDEEVTLSKEEGHHVRRVLRMRIGNEVVVFDGKGAAFRARISNVDRDAVTVALVESVGDAPQSTLALTLVQSILKGDAMDHVVRDCTMIGVDAIQPIVSEHTTVKTSLVAKSLARWRRVALASTKQCGRLRLPEILDPGSFDDWMKRHGGPGGFLLVEPAASVPNTVTIRDLVHRPALSSATLIVGPEGGWAPTERDLAIAAGCTPLSLSSLTLRADAVPLVACAALLAIWDR